MSVAEMMQAGISAEDAVAEADAGANLPDGPGEIIGYLIGGKVYHPADVLIVRAAP